MNAHIYALIDPRTNEIRYVGKARNVEKRLSRHLHEKADTYKCRWVNEMRRSGLAPVIFTLESFIDPDDSQWPEAERFWISYLKSIGCRLTNADGGGKSGFKKSPESIAKLRGLKRSPEQLARMSSARIGKSPSRESIEKAKITRRKTGWRPSPEMRLKMSLRLKGIKLSDEHKQKLSNSKSGIVFSAEHIENLRLSHLGKKQSQESIEKRSRSMRLAHARKRAEKFYQGCYI